MILGLNKLKIGLVLVLLFFVVSCTQASEKGAEINYKQGFMDIGITALGNTEEYQKQRLELPVSINNNLAYDLEKVEVSVLGFDNHYVDIYTDKQQLATLEGKNLFNPEGGMQKFLFDGMIKSLLPGAVTETQSYRIYVSYNSEVEFSPSLCVTSQRLESVGSAYDTFQGACTFQKEISYSGQGAPVGVTNLELVPRQGKQIELRMTIENRGKGKVGKISLAAATLGGKPLTCEFRGDTTKDVFSFDSEKKSATLVCAGYLLSEDLYTTPLYLQLLYDYEINQKEEMAILE